MIELLDVTARKIEWETLNKRCACPCTFKDVFNDFMAVSKKRKPYIHPLNAAILGSATRNYFLGER